MDLLERAQEQGERHPWEVARAFAIGELVSRLGLAHPRTLDVGCGDAYLLRELVRSNEVGNAVGQDIYLTPAQIDAWSKPSLKLVTELSELEGERFELVLLLDVLEHVEDPASLVHELAKAHLEDGGRVVITVPAFQGLFTQHDRDLKHFRRYTRGEIANVAMAAGLRVHDSGYLFGSLLLPRAAGALSERVFGARKNGDIGVGRWQAPSALTQLLTLTLKLDNRLLIEAHDRGFTLPGLSAWLLCNLP